MVSSKSEKDQKKEETKRLSGLVNKNIEGERRITALSGLVNFVSVKIG